LIEGIEAKHGKVLPSGPPDRLERNRRNLDRVFELLHRLPRLYRKDLWDEIGMTPTRLGQAQGQGLSDRHRPFALRRFEHLQQQLLWSYGVSVNDETGKRVTIDSKESLEAVKLHDGALLGGGGSGSPIVARRDPAA